MLDGSNGIRGNRGHSEPCTSCDMHVLLWKAEQGKERALAHYLLVGGATRQRPQQH